MNPNVCRVLLIDDEERVVRGLQRMLHGTEFSVSIATSGAQGLQLLNEQPFDVVVSDLRMVGMDGNEFLSEVCRLYPRIIRFILSGHAEKNLLLKTLGVTHQLLAKPCDQATLVRSIRRSLEFQSLFENDSIRSMVSQIKVLPTLPEVYLRLQELTNDPDAHMDSIIEVIQKDAPLTAKVLQVANSAFFGGGSAEGVSDLSSALRTLGVESIKSIVLVFKVFSQFEISYPPLESLWGHALQVACFSRSVGMELTHQKAFADLSYTAGLLHDVGKFVFSKAFPEEYRECLERARKEGRFLRELEREMFGIAHPEVGAYLLGLWGLPTPLVEAVRFHHDPLQAKLNDVSPLTATHLGEFLAHARERRILTKEEPCIEYLKQLSLDSEPQYWIEKFANLETI